MDINLDHLAKLSKLRLSDDERARLEKDLPAVIDYINKLQEVDTAAADVKAYLTDVTNVLREDEPVLDEEVRSAIIKAFPKQVAGMLEVPGVFND